MQILKVGMPNVEFKSFAPQKESASFELPSFQVAAQGLALLARHLTHRDYEIINVCCFKLPNTVLLLYSNKELIQTFTHASNYYNIFGGKRFYNVLDSLF